MIVSGQMSREEALSELNAPLYDENKMDEYITVICNKLMINRSQIEKYIYADNHSHSDYKSQEDLLTFRVKRGIKRFLHKV